MRKLARRGRVRLLLRHLRNLCMVGVARSIVRDGRPNLDILIRTRIVIVSHASKIYFQRNMMRNRRGVRKNAHTAARFVSYRRTLYAGRVTRCIHVGAAEVCLMIQIQRCVRVVQSAWHSGAYLVRVILLDQPTCARYALISSARCLALSVKVLLTYG